MAITRLQIGNDNVNNNIVGMTTGGAIHDTLPSGATAGSLLVFTASASTGPTHVTGPAGYVHTHQAVSGDLGVWIKRATGGETIAGITLDATATGSADCRLQEFDTGGLTLRPDAFGDAAFVTQTGVVLTTGNCSRSGSGLVIGCWRASAALPGFAATGLTVDASGQGARGYKTFTATAGASPQTTTASWTGTKTGAGLLALFTPASARRPVVCMIAG